MASMVTSSLFFFGALAFLADLSGWAATATTVYSSLSGLQQGTNDMLPTPPPRVSAIAYPNARRGGYKCSKSDIQINQGPSGSLPNGIPTYRVEISYRCIRGCKLSNIHVNCGWFSSASLIDPKIFKRLRYNDCLVNDGKPLANGGTISFQYANSFPYALSVSSVSCVQLIEEFDPPKNTNNNINHMAPHGEKYCSEPCHGIGE